MKKVKYLLLFIVLILVTGCSSYDMSMDIQKNKSMNFTVLIGSNSNDGITDGIASLKDKYEKYGYSVSEYNDEDKHGIKISKRFDNIDDISRGVRKDEFDLLYLYNNEYNEEYESKMFNVDKGFAINRYAANFFVDLSNTGLDLNNTTVTFNVSVPNGTISSNANVVSDDRNNLTWNITSMDKTEIDFVFELNSYDYVYYAVAVLLAIFLFFSIISNFGNKTQGSFSKQLENNTDLDKKIEHLKQMHQTKNSNTNKQVEVNNKPNNVNTKKTVNMDLLAKPNNNHKSQELPKNTDDSNKITNSGPSLVPELDMTNFKTPVKEKKKGIFGLGSKNKKKKEDNSINSNNKVSDSFSSLVDSINKSQSNGVNVNNQVMPVSDINAELDSIYVQEPVNNNTPLNNNEIINVPVMVTSNNINTNSNSSNNGVNYELNGADVNANNDINMNSVSVIGNPNMDINYNPSAINDNKFENFDSSFVYVEQPKIDEKVNATTEIEESELDSPVIRVNNQSVIVKKNDNE